MAENRYEREIDDLLRQLEGEQRDPLPFRRRRASPWSAAWRRVQPLLGTHSAVERLMALAVVLLLATFVMGLFAPRLSGPLALLAVASLVVALALSVLNGAAGHSSAYSSRGRYAPAAGAAVDWDGLMWRFRRWLRRLRG
ncbi:MAG TPA: hypothetical protein VII06_35145 [Chloroflexota bacterium]|jgi:hypothetical protein